MLSLMGTKVSLIVKVLRKRNSLMCFRVRLEVQVRKNPTALVVGVPVLVFRAPEKPVVDTSKKVSTMILYLYNLNAVTFWLQLLF